MDRETVIYANTMTDDYVIDMVEKKARELFEMSPEEFEKALEVGELDFNDKKRYNDVLSMSLFMLVYKIAMKNKERGL